MSQSNSHPAMTTRFNSLRDAFRNMFQVVSSGVDGGGIQRFSIKNVPMFMTYQGRGHSCDEDFLDRMVHNFHLPARAIGRLADDPGVAEKFGWRPKVHKHHTPEDPDSSNRPEVIGFVDDLYRVENLLFGDIAGLDKSSLNELRSNKYPDRSPEVDPHRARLLSLAVLGAEAPHFSFPQMRNFSFRDQVVRHENDETSWCRFKESDLMSTTYEKTLTPLEVQAHIMSLPEDDERRVFFVRHMGEQMGAAMSGGQNPQGVNMGSLEAIIKNVIMQMTSQQFNQPAGGGGQMGQGMASSQMGQGQFSAKETERITSLLDLESPLGHHDHDSGGGGGKSVSESEDGTVPHSGIDGLGGSVKSAGLTKRGQPATSTTGGSAAEYDDLASESGLTKSVLESAVSTMKHALKGGTNSEQVEAALSTIVETHNETLKFAQKQAGVIRVLDGKIRSAEHETLKHALTETLVRLRAERYIGVGDEKGIEKHVGILLSLPVERHEDYINALKSAGRIAESSVRHQSKGSVDSSDWANRVDRHKARLQSDPDLRDQAHRMGVGAEDIVMAEAYGTMMDVEPEGDSSGDVF